jgi:CheY-like chemotaxis protein
MILYLAADLLWASKIKATADALGVGCRPVRTMEMLEARLAEATPQAPVRALLVDLDKPEEALAMIARLRDPARLKAESSPDNPRITIVAWGPHVAKDLLQSARTAGADEVLTRGAFDHHLQDILLKLAGRA